MSRLNSRKLGQRLRERNKQRQLQFETFEDRCLLATFAPIAGTADGTNDSLRAAIQTSNTNNEDDIIILDAGTYAIGISGAGDDDNDSGDFDLLDTGNSVTISGAGAGVTIIDGAGLDRLFDIFSTVSVVIEDVTITGGALAGSNDGGAIRSLGSLELIGVEITNNSARDGGALLLDHSAVITDSVLSNNTASRNGGAIKGFAPVVLSGSVISDNSSNSNGGGYDNDGAVNIFITDSTFSGNSAGLNGGGFNNSGGRVHELHRVTFSDNTTGARGGGFTNDGGRFISVRNVTVTGNSAGQVGGGIDNFGGIIDQIINSTVVFNDADDGGGGVQNEGGDISPRNSMFANNDSPVGPDYNGKFIGQGFNLIENTTGIVFRGDQTGNVVGVEPDLGPLQDNGGMTETHELLEDSAGIDEGTTSAAPAVDQRGEARPQGLTVDIGAFEAPPNGDFISPTAAVVEVTPDPRNSVVGLVTINFDEDVVGVDIADFSLTLDGNAIDISGLTVNSVSAAEYTIDLSTVTTADGDFVFTLTALNSGIEDLSANLLLNNSSDTWAHDGTPPVANIIDLDPNPTMTEVTSLTVNFTEDVQNLDLADFSLTFNGNVVDLAAGGATVTPIDTLNYSVNLNGLAAADGDYVLTLSATATVNDLLGNAIAGGDVEAWSKDDVSPTGDIVDVTPDPRQTAVGVVTINFDEDVLGVDLAAFTLVRDGDVLDLNALGATFVAVSDSEFEIDLTNVGGTEGEYTLGVTGVVTDIAGNVLAGTPLDTWDIDLSSPVPTLGTIDPLIRNAQPTPAIAFNEPITELTLDDFTLTRDGNVIDLQAEGISLFTLFGAYNLGLGGHDLGEGQFQLTVDLSGIVDSVGNEIEIQSLNAAWEIDTTIPTADIVEIDPDPTDVSVATITINFDSDVTLVDLGDFTFDRDGVVLDLAALGASLTQITPSQYQIDLSPAGLTDVDGLYTLTLVAAGSRIRDAAQNEIQVDVVEVWRKDGGRPEADIVNISPDPRTTEVGVVSVEFTEDVLNVDVADFVLTLNGNVVDISGIPFTAVNASTYELDLSAVTTDDGAYVLTLLDTGGITDLAGSDLLASVSDSWFTDGTPPTVDIVDISPDPGTAATTSVTINFSEEISGFELTDLVFTRDGSPVNLVTFGAELTQESTTQFTLDLLNLASLDGTYVLSLAAATSGIVDPTGNDLAGDASDSWLLDGTPPAADIVNISPDPRTTEVGTVFINFSEEVANFSIEELTLTLDGNPIDISGLQLVTQGPTQFELDLTGVATQDGVFLLTLLVGDITDVVGNPLDVSVSDTWVMDATPPSVDIIDVDPNPRQTAVPSIDIQFTETVFNFDIGDLSLTVGGNVVDLQASGATLTMVDNLNYTLNLNGLADGDGEFVVTVNIGDIEDQIGNSLTAAVSEAWSQDTTAPTVDIVDVNPDPRNIIVSDLTFQFSEPITGLDLTDIFLTRDFITVNIDTAILAEVSPGVYELDLSGAGHTDIDGTYRIQLFDANTGITDLAGNALVAGATDEWFYHGTPPVAIFPVFDPQVRSTVIFGATLIFDEAITGLDLGDFTLTLDGQPVDLVAAGASINVAGLNEFLVNLNTAAESDGTYVLTFNAVGSEVIDDFGNAIVSDAVVVWSLDRVSPLVDIIDVTPDPSPNPVTELTIQFTEAVLGFDIDDLTLTSNGNPVDLSTASLADNGGGTFLLDIGSLANADANYVLSLNAGNEIVDIANNPLASPTPVTDDWRVDAQSPQVVSVEINSDKVDPADLPVGVQPTSWTRQRSDILSVVITFDDEIVLGTENITFTNLGINADADPDTVMTIDSSQVVVTGNVATINFANDEVVDGVLQLELDAAVTDLSGNPLDGDGDGDGGDGYILTGNNANKFYRLKTDWSGDAGVSVFDFSTFSYWFGKPIQRDGGEAPNYADVNRDGGVSVFDFNPFSLQFGIGVQFPVALAAFIPLGDDAQGEAAEEELIEVAIEEPPIARADIRDDQVDNQRESLDSIESGVPAEALEDTLDEIVADIATFWSN